MRVLLCSLSAFIFCNVAHATDSFYLDYFANYKSNTATFDLSAYDSWSTNPAYLNFRDDFNDNLAPPSAPNFSNGSPTSYGVKGTFLEGAEQSGYLLMNPITEGAPGEDAVGTSRLTLYARLPTNSAVGSTAGLRFNSAFAVEARYQLAVPDTGLNYGIRLSDQVGTGNQDDYIELRLRTTTTGVTQFSLIHQDFLNDTSVLTGSKTFAALSGASQVGFLLLHSTSGTATVEGFYRFYDVSGASLNSWTKVGASDIFHGEDFTQASFISGAPVPVPEPHISLLFSAGLAILGLARKHLC